MSAIHAIILAAIQSAAPAGQHPRIVFTQADLPRLCARIEREPMKHCWDQVLRMCERDLRPASLCQRVLKGMEAGDLTSLAKQTGYRPDQLVAGRAWEMTFLAFAGRLAERTAYKHEAKRLVLTMARRYSADSLTGVTPGEKCDINHMCFHMGLTYDFLAADLSEPERALVRGRLADYCRRCAQTARESWWGLGYTEWPTRTCNWGPVIGCQWAMGALAIEGEPGYDPSWLGIVKQMTQNWLDNTIDAQGACHEGVGYWGYPMCYVPYFAEALRLRGDPLWRHPHLKASTQWLAYEVLPGGYQTNNIAHTTKRMGGAGGYVYMTHVYPDDPLIQWLWLQRLGPKQLIAYPVDFIPVILWAGKTGALDPGSVLPDAHHFRGRGLVYFKTGWGPDDIMFSFECDEQRIGSHDHGDKTSFTLYAYGNGLVSDAGHPYYDPKAHSTILVDGVGQGEPRDWVNADKNGGDTVGHIIDFAAGDFADLAAGDAKPAYDTLWWGTAKVWSEPWMPVRRARRAVAFVKAPGHPYFLIADDIDRDGQPHDYTWLLQTFADNAVTLAGSRAHIEKDFLGAFVEHPSPTPMLGPDGKAWAGRAEFEFELPRTGRYALWGYGRATPGDYYSDSFGLQLDAGPRHQYRVGNDLQPWQWRRMACLETAQAQGVELAAGRHVLRLDSMKPGARLGMVLVTPDVGFTPVSARVQAPLHGALLHAAEAKVVHPFALRPGDPGRDGMLDVVFVHPRGVSLRLGKSPTKEGPYQLRLEATARAVNPRFLTLLYPRRRGMPLPEIETPDARRAAGCVLVWDDAQDTVVSAWGQPGECRGLATDGAIAVVRTRRDERAPSQFLLQMGTLLTYRGKPLVRAVGAGASVVVSPRRVCIRADKATTVTALAPASAPVFLNGARVSATRQAGYVTVSH